MPSYFLNDDVFYCDISDNIATIMDPSTGISWETNRFSAILLENLLNRVPTGNITAALKALPNVPADIVSRFDRFTALLVHKKILKESDPLEAACIINAAIAAQEGFNPELYEINDSGRFLLDI
ncbi:hypothetical protein AGMMS50230_21330 [Spirochaetia bacterium]|nr:hypothetical protein AGMMS50230_21330 [Spirochaetia bacterium]